MLFSATPTQRIQELARLSLKSRPLYVGVDDSKDKATVEGLTQVGWFGRLVDVVSVLSLELWGPYVLLGSG